MKRIMCICALLCAMVGCKGELSFFNDKYSDDERIEAALKAMTLDEKVAVLHAQSKFSSAGVPRLGIPSIWTSDGPHGVRAEVLWDEWDQANWTTDSCTAFPALTCLAATWNTELANIYGVSIGEEARFRGKNVLLGPGVNIARTPLNGRNFEYMGEDPYLASQMVVPYVKGVQSNAVAACVKHYALNNQELNRHTTDVAVSDRALHEIYLPAYKAAVKEAGAWAIMGAYNLYKDEHCCHNQVLLNDILKRDWAFDGVVISDWGGVSSTDEAVRKGMDMEFGTWTDGLSEGYSNAYSSYYLAEPYKAKLKAGEYGTEELDEKVRRILRLQLRTNFSRTGYYGRFTCPEHYEAARRIGAEGIVLLKNDAGLLPLAQDKSILVVGENAMKVMTIGGGSSSLKVSREVSPLDGIKARFDNVIYQRGYVGSMSDSFDNVVTKVDMSESRSAEKLLADALDAAAKVDVVIFVGGLNKDPYQDCEGIDRLSYDLPYGQDAVIEALAKVNPNTVVVNISGTPVAMPWADKVAAIVQDWYLGSEAGTSLADVLSGDVNPSGKLPFSFPYALADGPIKSAKQYPGIFDEKKGIWYEEYSEGVMVGYRWYDTMNVEPRYEFGYGLSYTKFEYGTPVLKGRKLRVPISNVGERDGAEIVQLYIADIEASVERPAKELKGFKKIFLKAGQTAYAEFEIDDDALSFYDEIKGDWVLEPGRFKAIVAASSRDIRGEIEFEVK